MQTQDLKTQDARGEGKMRLAVGARVRARMDVWEAEAWPAVRRAYCRAGEELVILEVRVAGWYRAAVVGEEAGAVFFVREEEVEKVAMMPRAADDERRDVLGAITRRFAAAQAASEEDWEIYKFLRDEESMAAYVRHLRRCQMLKKTLAGLLGAGGGR